eukprot:scaffold8027_cov145-Skeletonema_marinoi.AAC.2
MKRKIITDDIMTSSTSSTGSKWERTNLRLAASSNSASGGFSTGSDNADSKDADDYYLCLPTLDSSSTMAVDDPDNDDNNHDDAQHQRSRTTRQLQHLFELDLYLSSVPQLAASTRQLLQSSSSSSSTTSTANNHHNNSNNHKVITSSNSGRVINVLQGEMAHCTPSQADVLMSDDATTCHILGLWSHLSLDYSSRSAQHRDQMQQQQNGGDGNKLATVAHIDSPDYEDCIRDAVDLHYRYHSSQLSSSSSSSSSRQQQTRLNGNESTIILPVIELSIHLMGGYNDSDGTSHEITQGVLRALSNISDEHVNRQHHQQPRLQMILQTCAVSSSNDNGSGCPIGRGLALDVSSGKVYLAEVGEDDVESSSSSSSSSSSLLLDNSTTVVITSTSAKGPDCLLRQARLWASFIFNNGENESNDDDSKRRLQIIHHPNDEYLYISPFYFASHPFPHRMLALNDALLLQYTSSSPEVEKDNFVRCVRETFRYMNGTTCFHVFKKKKVMNEDDDGEKDVGLDDWWDDEDYLPRRYRRVGLNGWAAVA